VSVSLCVRLRSCASGDGRREGVFGDAEPEHVRRRRGSAALELKPKRGRAGDGVPVGATGVGDLERLARRRSGGGELDGEVPRRRIVADRQRGGQLGDAAVERKGHGPARRADQVRGQRQVGDRETHAGDVEQVLEQRHLVPRRRGVDRRVARAAVDHHAAQTRAMGRRRGGWLGVCLLAIGYLEAPPCTATISMNFWDGISG